MKTFNLFFFKLMVCNIPAAPDNEAKSWFSKIDQAQAVTDTVCGMIRGFGRIKAFSLWVRPVLILIDLRP